jgi:flavin reductase (DIM6/NTAB) family NADH-FMN oxidoreductase RutF
MLAVNITSKGDVLKDTARNIRESGEFVVNVAVRETMETMHASAAEYPSDVSETDALNIALLPSTRVKPPRIAASPVQMECKLDQYIVLGKGRNTLYIGEVLAFHLSTDVYDGQRVDSIALDPIARLGGPNYAALGEIYNRPMLQRPPGGEGWVHQHSTPTKD